MLSEAGAAGNGRQGVLLQGTQVCPFGPPQFMFPMQPEQSLGALHPQVPSPRQSGVLHPQLAHAKPLFPHCVLSPATLPGTHVPPAQHPPLHSAVAVGHEVEHSLATQAWYMAQSV